MDDKTVYEDDYEKCWMTGNYDDYHCPDCPHYYDCSGVDAYDE